MSGKVSRSAEFGLNRAYGVGKAGAPKQVKQGIFRNLGGTDPKTTGRLGGPGDLPKVQPAHPTYGKSASMVWGRRNQFYDIWVLSVHVNLAPAANSSTHIYGKPVLGARKNTKS